MILRSKAASALPFPIASGICRLWKTNQSTRGDLNARHLAHLITGGGGGGLETPGPFRTPFSQMVQRGHHYAMVWVNGTHLEYKAYTLEGRLFDSFSLKKPPVEGP